MNDMTSVIVPKSDQWNADDFISGPRTFRIVGVQIKAGQDQPVSIAVEGSSKVFRPCKSMSRVLVSLWGPDASKYDGRSLTLYRDPTVTWGGMAVGGIRISHLSDITRDATMALTTTKSARKMYTVKPLVDAPAVKSSDAPAPELAPTPDAVKLIVEGNEAANFGMDALRAFWGRLPGAEKRAAGGEEQIARWKQIATVRDAERQDAGEAA